jgi:hypothetical protein
MLWPSRRRLAEAVRTFPGACIDRRFCAEAEVEPAERYSITNMPRFLSPSQVFIASNKRVRSTSHGR